MPCSYRQCVTFFTEELPWLKGRDLELVMGRGLCDWIGWDLGPEASGHSARMLLAAMTACHLARSRRMMRCISSTLPPRGW